MIPYLNKVTVAEITSQNKGYPTEVDIGQHANLPMPSFVQLDTIQTIPKQHLEKCLGALEEALMRTVSEKVVLALNLEEAFSAL